MFIQNLKIHFFLFYTPVASHGPVYSSEAFAHKSKRGLIGNSIQELDWSIGQIVGALDRNGILGDTLVVFSSDNGAACVGYLEESGSNGPLTPFFMGSNFCKIMRFWVRNIIRHNRAYFEDYGCTKICSSLSF